MINVTVSDYRVLQFWYWLDEEINERDAGDALATAFEIQAIFPQVSGERGDIWKAYDLLKAGRLVKREALAEQHSGCG
jgi:hypothetical protein